MSPSVDVCVVTYGNADTIEACVASIAERAPGAGIRVLDNSPDDATWEVLQRLMAAHPGRLVAARAGDNLGFGRACNRLAAESTAEWVAFLNPDATLDRLDVDWDSYGPSDVVGAEVYSPDGSLAATAGPPRDLRHEVALRWFRRRDVLPGGTRRAVGLVSGAALAMRREAFTGLGGFDADRYFMYYEDIDLCTAAGRVGGTVWRDPAWRVTHIGGHSARKDHAVALRRSHEAARNYHEKWERGALTFTAICFVEAVLKSGIALLRGRVGTTDRATQLAHTAFLGRRCGQELARVVRRQDG